MAEARTKRPRPPKLARHPQLRAVVERRLAERWSPQQISRRLELDFPDHASMRVSHETIYMSLFVQAKGGLPGQLAVHLRTRRVRRRPQRRVYLGPPRIKDMAPIPSPTAGGHRLVLGHWEGDLMVGRRGGSHVGTLVERRSRYLLILHLPDGAGTDSVIAALTAATHQLPPVLATTYLCDVPDDDDCRGSRDWPYGRKRRARFSPMTPASFSSRIRGSPTTVASSFTLSSLPFSSTGS